MKNIIKRGTSLLLVLAMLLSFAAVVGAEEPTTTTPEKILTLTKKFSVKKDSAKTNATDGRKGTLDSTYRKKKLHLSSEKMMPE